MIRKITVLALAGLFGAALYAADKPVTVSLKDADGKDVGTAKIADKGAGVKIGGERITARNLGLAKGRAHRRCD